MTISQRRPRKSAQQGKISNALSKLILRFTEVARIVHAVKDNATRSAMLNQLKDIGRSVDALRNAYTGGALTTMQDYRLVKQVQSTFDGFIKLWTDVEKPQRSRRKGRMSKIA